VEPGAWSLEHGRWRMEFLEHGRWSLVAGAWSLAHGGPGLIVFSQDK